MSQISILQNFQGNGSKLVDSKPQWLGNSKWILHIYPLGRAFAVSANNLNPHAQRPNNTYGSLHLAPEYLISCETDKLICVNIRVCLNIPNQEEQTIFGEKRACANSFEVGGPLHIGHFSLRTNITLKVEITSNQSLDSRLDKALSCLRDNRDLTDCVLKIDGEELAVHKLVLAARSDVFKAMFYGSMSEATSSEVNIDDVELAVMSDFISFIYGNSCSAEALKLHADKLYTVAQKYNVKELMEICQIYLTSCLTPEIAASTLALAEKFNDKDLKSEAIKFIAKNPKECVSNPKFFSLLNPVLIVEAFKAVAGVEEQIESEEKSESFDLGSNPTLTDY